MNHIGRFSFFFSFFCVVCTIFLGSRHFMFHQRFMLFVY